MRNLGKQVGGGVEGWDERQIAAIAGPGQDRTRVGEAVEAILNQTPLSGWEQDDHERCAGYSYVLVRVQKGRARQFLAENAKFHSKLVERLDNKITQIGTDLESMKAAYANLTADLEALKHQDRAGIVSARLEKRRNRVEKIMGAVKDGLNKGATDPAVHLKLLEAANGIADLKIRRSLKGISLGDSLKRVKDSDLIWQEAGSKPIGSDSGERHFVTWATAGPCSP